MKKSVKKYTKQEITEMADRCFRRCWYCDRYEPCGGYGSGGDLLFSYVRTGCYEAHDLPWKSGHWCPFQGDKHHPDAKNLKSLTWGNVFGTVEATKLVEPYELREKILNANPEIAVLVKYCENSNEEREQYFNKSENQAIIEFDKFNVYCETLRRYRFSLVDNRLLYPGANEWLRSMMVFKFLLRVALIKIIELIHKYLHLMNKQSKLMRCLEMVVMK